MPCYGALSESRNPLGLYQQTCVAYWPMLISKVRFLQAMCQLPDAMETLLINYDNDALDAPATSSRNLLEHIRLGISQLVFAEACWPARPFDVGEIGATVHGLLFCSRCRP